MDIKTFISQYRELDASEQVQVLNTLFLSVKTSTEDPKPSTSTTTSRSLKKNENLSTEHLQTPSKKEERPPDYDAYPTDFKKEAVDLNNNRKATRDLKRKYESAGKYQKLDESVIRDWRNNPEYNARYEWNKSRKARPRARDTTCAHPDMENHLISLIKDRRKEGKPVSRSWIISEALKISSDPLFKGSDGWFANFRRRQKLSLRVSTKIVQKLSEDYCQAILGFMGNIKEKRVEYEEKRKIQFLFGNLDQVPFQRDEDWKDL